MLSKWFSLATLFLLMTPPVSPAADAAAQRPNFIFILAEDLGWSDLGCYELSERALAWQKELPTGPTDPGVGQMSYPERKGKESPISVSGQVRKSGSVRKPFS